MTILTLLLFFLCGGGRGRDTRSARNHPDPRVFSTTIDSAFSLSGRSAKTSSAVSASSAFIFLSLVLSASESLRAGADEVLVVTLDQPGRFGVESELCRDC
mgnify:CR=1 FL=1